MPPLLTTHQFKLDKSRHVGRGYLSGGITLAPGRSAARILHRALPTVCINAGVCEDLGCLAVTGHNQFPTHERARARRTSFWFRDPKGFIDQAVLEYQALERRATRIGYTAAGRPNLLSDLPGMARAIARRVPGVRFYDYTKIVEACTTATASSPVHLTYSVSERSTPANVRAVFASGRNCAVVVPDIGKGEPIPRTFTHFGITWPTIDGDRHDLRFLDEPRHWVILRWKGSRARRELATSAGWALPMLQVSA
jgi:hypothetical protein